jgi:release factor glutamine methyltransferase
VPSDSDISRVRTLIESAAHNFAALGIESSRLDAEVLMAEAAGVTREAIITGSIDLSPSILKKFEAMVARREKREPVAYIVGRKEFYSLDFEVSPAVLIPRPETEFVVTAALNSIAGKANAHVLDIGTGSGAIAIAIAVNAPNAQVTAADVSNDALALSARNAMRHQVESRITFRHADCFEVGEGESPLGFFDLIVSNPPYIDDESLAGLEPEVLNYEPRVALSAGPDGLNFFRRIAAGASGHLRSGGELIVEVGAGQAAAVSQIFERARLRALSVLNDFAGHPRVVRARAGGVSRDG